jgi:hypothetical protein
MPVDSVLGETYNYAAQIKTPKEMGMNGKGSWKQIEKNVNGIESYFTVLQKGGGAASKQKPGRAGNHSGGMGNRYFLSTGQKCAVGSDGTQSDRFLYMDHVPTPRTSQSYIFDGDVGLIPGLTNNFLSSIDPIGLATAFTDTNTTKSCIEVELTTIDKNNVAGVEKRHMSIADAKEVDPCWYTSESEKPPDLGTCMDGFSNMDMVPPTGGIVGSEWDDGTGTSRRCDRPFDGPAKRDIDIAETAYIMAIGGVGLYALHRLLRI